MSNESENEIIAGRWFTDFWGKTCNLGIVDELAAPDMLLQYSLREPRRGHADIKAFMTGLREAFPDLAFASTADLIAEGDYVVSRWEGGGTHIGLAFQRLSCRVFAGGYGPKDAVYRNNGASNRKRQDCRRHRFG
jgi:SnoaL-like polyketide cyclase